VKVSTTILGVAVAAASVAALSVAPASAKSASVSPASCTAGTTGNQVFTDLGGGRFNVGFSTIDTGAWNVQIRVDGAAVPSMDYSTDGVVPGVNITGVFFLGKGKHSFALLATNLTTGGSCTGFAGPRP
jgi:hypothetical protein